MNIIQRKDGSEDYPIVPDIDRAVGVWSLQMYTCFF